MVKVLFYGFKVSKFELQSFTFVYAVGKYEAYYSPNYE